MRTSTRLAARPLHAAAGGKGVGTVRGWCSMPKAFEAGVTGLAQNDDGPRKMGHPAKVSRVKSPAASRLTATGFAGEPAWSGPARSQPSKTPRCRPRTPRQFERRPARTGPERTSCANCTGSSCCTASCWCHFLRRSCRHRPSPRSHRVSRGATRQGHRPRPPGRKPDMRSEEEEGVSSQSSSGQSNLNYRWRPPFSL